MRRVITALPLPRRSAAMRWIATTLPKNVAVENTPAKPHGATMKDFGFQHSTPNFNVDFENLPNDVDLGEVSTKDVQTVDVEKDLYGPWIALAEKVRGELFVDRDRLVYYRPASGLGFGVGELSLMPPALGSVTFTIDIELFAYENSPSHPPNEPERLFISGRLQSVRAEKSQYQTMTMQGLCVSSANAEQKDANYQQFSAAKLTPWTPKPVWRPEPELSRAMAQLFTPVTLTSHLKRRDAAGASANGDPVHIELQKYKVGPISGVYYIPNYITEEEEAAILSNIKKTPDQLKEKMTKRTVQEWGCSMCPTCQKSFLSDMNLPRYAQDVTDMMIFDGLFTPSTFPNSVRIHEYEKGEGIAPHCDGPIYVPNVVILSLASTSVMAFYPRREPYAEPMEHYKDTFRFDGDIANQRPIMSVVMEPRSLLIFRGEAYTHYPHGVSDKAVDLLSPEHAGEVVNRHLISDPQMSEVRRTYRVGVTVRNLLPRCTHFPERTEYLMKRAWRLYNQLPLPEPVASDSATSHAVPQYNNPPPTPQQLSVAEIQSLHTKIDSVMQQLSELRQLFATGFAAEERYRSETSTILNHLSATVLQLESSVEEIAEHQKNVK